MVYLRDIEVSLPETVRSNEDLVRMNPTWDAGKIYAKTGIRARRVAGPDETAADLGCRAAARLLDRPGVDRSQVDALLFCTESPDYPLPPTACTLQTRLGLSVDCAALDYNLGCSGFTYGLWLANALVESASARNVLLIVADTYSKYCNPHDLATVAIFGDGGAAALITADSGLALAKIGATVLGTDGRGAEHLIVRGGAYLAMNGPAVYAFTLSAVQASIQKLLDKVGLQWQDVDLFLLHQANRYMLDQLRINMQIPAEKMPIDMEDIGNTVSASIPLLIRRCADRAILKAGDRCVLAGFGVGYSWATTFVQWLAAG
jgi:3-oxoacyl-[acyl-carrier-protein] synthase-3